MEVNGYYQPVYGTQPGQPAAVTFVSEEENSSGFLAGCLSTFCCGFFGFLVYIFIPTAEVLSGALFGLGSNCILTGILFISVSSTHQHCTTDYGTSCDNTGASRQTMVGVGVVLLIIGVLMVFWGWRKRRSTTTVLYQVSGVGQAQPIMGQPVQGYVMPQQAYPQGYGYAPQPQGYVPTAYPAQNQKIV